MDFLGTSRSDQFILAKPLVTALYLRRLAHMIAADGTKEYAARRIGKMIRVRTENLAHWPNVDEISPEAVAIHAKLYGCIAS